MIKFGPAGNCDRFYAEGYKASEQAPAWIAAQGLDAYEYAAGHGLTLKEEKARETFSRYKRCTSACCLKWSGGIDIEELAAAM